MSRSVEKKNQPELTKEDPPALNIRTRISDKQSTPDSTSHVDSQFSEGDRVVIQTVREKPITGTVRWVGPVKMSKKDGGIVVPVVGIETVS